MVFEIELNAEAFNGAKVIEEYDTYQRKVEGIFIPLDINGGYKKWKVGVKFYLKSFDSKKVKGEEHFIITPTISEKRKRTMIDCGMIKEGENPCAIVGTMNMRIDLFRFKEKTKSKELDEILGK